jgi:CHAT domain-containing protein/Tfp pilus assembly protein PilF
MRLLWLTISTVWIAGAIGAEEPHRGVVVECVTKQYSAERAGLQEGDLLVDWHRADTNGQFHSPFDLLYVEIDQGPRGPVTLQGQRRGREQSWIMGPEAWGLRVRPILSDELLREYRQARELETAGEPMEAAQHLRAASAHTDGEEASWILSRAAEILAKGRRWNQCDDAYRAALSRAPADPAAAAISHDLGLIAEGQGDLVRAEAYHRQALSIRQEHAPQSLSVAASLNALARVARQRGTLNHAEELARNALAIEKAIAPESLAVAGTFNELGFIAWKRGDLDKAQEYDQTALRLANKLAPDRSDTALSLNNLGLVSWRRGDLDKAEEYFRAALAMREKLAPGSLDVAGSLNGLGVVAMDRGDLSGAEKYFRASLNIRERLAPGSLEVAANLNNLTIVLWNRGDLAKAEELGRAALTIREKLAPGSLDVAATLSNLGSVCRDRGDLIQAEEYQGAALKIQEELAPQSVDAAISLGNLGLLKRDRGDLNEAERYHRAATKIFERLAPGSEFHAKSLATLGNDAKYRGNLAVADDYYRAALPLLEKLAPGSLDVADILFDRGDVALKRNDLQKAEEFYRAALAIRENLAPGSIEHADALAAIGHIMQRRGNVDTAAELLGQSLDALERQTSELGGSGSLRARFRSEHAGYYRDYINILLARARPDAAFHVVERSRARSLLEMLAERDLVFASDLPSEIRDARKRNAAAYDSMQSDMASLSPDRDAAKIQQGRKRLRELEREREDITERVRLASPHLATLQYPQPVNLEGARQVLDPGTALLSYVVTEEQTVLFVVLPPGKEPGLSVLSIPISRETLRAQVRELRTLIESAGDSNAAVGARLKQLYALLVRPAEPIIESSTRLLLVPDGPLQLVPFAALRRDSGEYLVEWKPLHTALSATVYAELKDRRNHQEAKQLALAAFGDPIYSASAKSRPAHTSEGELRWASERGLILSRLLFSGLEVESIANAVAGRSQKYLGAEATEEHAKALGNDVRYIHFATHGLLDERFPLNSGLALTFPPKWEEGHDNGLLQAWEIFEQLRMDADLVTLSGCNTALGQELDGEGLIGMTRAFQYAGAHSVMASLWSIDDRKTSRLMERFYRELSGGKTKDEALRAAQISLLRSPATARVRYWAAFVLNGDWR